MPRGPSRRRPAAKAPVRRRGHGSGRRTGPPGKMILLVHDTDPLSAPERTFLQRAGFRIATARSGAEALEVMGRRAPDLVLLDTRMSALSGERCLAEMRKREGLKDIPVVVIAENARDLRRCRMAGADDGVMRPAAREVLMEKIGSVLRIPVRVHPRLDVRILVRYENIDLFLTDYASNLSCGGIFIRTAHPLHRGTRTRLEFRIPEISSPITTHGRVVWSGRNASGHTGMGIQFDGLDANAKRMINEFVDKSIGETGS